MSFLKIAQRNVGLRRIGVLACGALHHMGVLECWSCGMWGLRSVGDEEYTGCSTSDQEGVRVDKNGCCKVLGLWCVGVVVCGACGMRGCNV